MRLALVQQRASRDRGENLRRGLAALRRAAEQGAELVVFPELSFEPFYPVRAARPGEPLALAETVPGPTIESVSEACRLLGVVAVVNLLERDAGRTFDTSVVIDADGSLVGRQRMLHITDYEGFREKSWYAPGDLGAPLFATRAGRLGVAICYDRHYPEVMRALAGADLVCVPQAGAEGEWPEGMFEAEVRTAAFQNGYFAALANRVGEEPPLRFAGGSFVCDPSGRLVARAASGEEDVLLVDLDLSTLPDAPARRLFLRDRRPEIVADLFGGAARP